MFETADHSPHWHVSFERNIDDAPTYLSEKQAVQHLEHVRPGESFAKSRSTGRRYIPGIGVVVWPCKCDKGNAEALETIGEFGPGDPWEADLDTAGSASSQNYIDTGAFLLETPCEPVHVVDHRGEYANGWIRKGLLDTLVDADGGRIDTTIWVDLDGEAEPLLVHASRIGRGWLTEREIAFREVFHANRASTETVKGRLRALLSPDDAEGHAIIDRLTKEN